MFTNELYIATLEILNIREHVFTHVAPLRALPWERSRKSAHATGALPCKTARGPAQSQSIYPLHERLRSL